MELNYQKILNQLPILVYVAAPDAIEIMFYNDSWVRYTGFSLEEMKSGWHIVVHPDDIGWMTERLNEAVRTKTKYTFEFRLYSRPLHGYRWVLANCDPIFRDTEIEGWIGTITDITEGKLTVHEREVEYERQIALRTTRIKELEQEVSIHQTLNN